MLGTSSGFGGALPLPRTCREHAVVLLKCLRNLLSSRKTKAKTAKKRPAQYALAHVLVNNQKRDCSGLDSDLFLFHFPISSGDSSLFPWAAAYLLNEAKTFKQTTGEKLHKECRLEMAGSCAKEVRLRPLLEGGPCLEVAC